MSISRRTFLWAAGASALAMRRITAAESEDRDVAWLDEVQRSPAELPEDAPQLAPLLADDDGNPIESLAGWKKRRDEIRRTWEDFIRPLKIKRPAVKLTVVEEDRPPGCIRRLVRYQSEPGIAVEGYLLLPEKIDDPVPGVVALHSTVNHTIRQPAGVEGKPEKAFGLKLAQRGVVAFCPRCFLWEGDGGYREKVAQFQKRHPGSLGMAKMLWDAGRGLDVLESLPQVDATRLGAVGHSLGAKEALYLAAFDERVKATVSSEGGIGTRFSNWHDPWYLGEGVRDGTFRREHHELLALVAPRPFLLIGGDSADGRRSWPFIEAALPVYRLYGGRPRLGLFIHPHGHSVPPEAERRIDDWLLKYLGAG